MARKLNLAILVVLLTIADGCLKTLLFRHESGVWALPSGIPDSDEDLQQAAERVIRGHLDVSTEYLEQLYTFGGTLNPSGERIIEVAYYGLVPTELLQPNQQRMPESINWFPVVSLPRLLGDHAQVVEVAHLRLRGKLAYTAVGFELLPATFTLAELQNLYEIILGKVLDKRNFRKKVLDLGILEPTGERFMTVKGRGRPASRWRFRPEVFQSIDTKRDIFQF